MAIERLGKNIGKYLGEGIDIQRILAEMERLAAAHDWQAETFFETDAFRLLAFIRRVPNPKKRIYISTGIHGDEPAGPLAILQMLQEDQWPADADVWLCPCLNPTGFRRNSRENVDGTDLNRDYLNPTSKETRAHIAWLEKQPRFDVCFCIHEDWESNGFYLYELNPDKQSSLARTIIDQVATVCPVDMSPIIEDRPAVGGIINPEIDPRSRPQWPEAFYLITNKTRLSYTLEAPSDFSLPVRVTAEIVALTAALTH